MLEGTTPFTGGKIGKIERDGEYIRYMHIEKYAEYLGIPTGMILIFSRMFANKRDGTHRREENEDLAAKIVAVMKRVTNETEFDIEELREWQKILKTGQTNFNL